MSSLAGKRIVVTRPRQQAGSLLEKLAGLGAVPIALPVIEIEPLEDNSGLDRAISELDRYAWVIFTSVNGVAAFWERLAACDRDGQALNGVKVAAIGPATARSLEERGVKPGFVPDEYIAEAIAAGLGNVQGQRILLARADIARKALAEELRRSGALPDEIAVYRTAAIQPDPGILSELKRGFDVVTFTSASTVHGFASLIQRQAFDLPSAVVVACIGPITAAAAQQYGLQVQLVASEYTSDGLLQALVDYFQGLPEGKPIYDPRTTNKF